MNFQGADSENGEFIMWTVLMHIHSRKRSVQKVKWMQHESLFHDLVIQFVSHKEKSFLVTNAWLWKETTVWYFTWHATVV